MGKYVKVMYGTTSGVKSDFISHGGKNDCKDTNYLVKEIEEKLYCIKNS